MIRYRRYRAFLVFAVLAIFALYEFSGFSSVTSAIGAGSLTKAANSQEYNPQAPLENGDTAKAQAAPEGVQPVQPESPKFEQNVDLAPASTKQAAPVTTALAAESLKESSSSSSSSATTTTSTQTPQTPLAEQIHELDDIAESGEGRKEVVLPPPALSAPAIHWSKQPEHFPVETTIQLPTGTPKAMPRIQHKFSRESSSELAARKEKLKVISDAVAHSWSGYKEKAWMKDEVRPVTGGSRDPFCGWAATLVDALDTLWIVGLEEEFEAAVEAVGSIDFTTSQRKDIPLFETTIRYLGGMLSAYDLSGAKYKVLLDKSVELAEILMGAFDTPNRMPVTYYRWMPTFASQPHRAGTHVVMAELGSLSMEFTRLAQLTKEPKYYDAIDRITDAFLEWQNAPSSNATLIPGLFPIHVDASGCEKPAQIKTHHTPTNYAANGGSVLVGDGAGVKAAEKPVVKEQSSLPGKVTEKADSSPMAAQAEADTSVRKTPPQKGEFTANKGKIIGWDEPLREGDLDAPEAKAAVLNGAGSDHVMKRQLGGFDGDDEKTKALVEAVAQKETEAKKKILNKEICVPRGLASSNSYGTDTFSIGGMADSTYEYFPKQYLLLGGLEDKYRVLYEQSMDAVIDKLLFRPMTPNDSDILFAGEFSAHKEPDVRGSYGALMPKGAHLTCFAGGMFALGAKVFGRKEDLDFGAKLTEGCVWAYNVTATGIMPEDFSLSQCGSMTNCPWNQTKYYEDLDPHRETRPTTKQDTKPKTETYDSESKTVSPELGSAKHKRQLDDEVRPTSAPVDKASSPVDKASSTVPESVPEPIPHRVASQKHYEPLLQPTHEEFVLARIHDERLPLGITRIMSRKYILRPEAIESVFYMYRITGEEHWREVGWQMFEAVHKYTYAPYGASAISDVTASLPEQDDTEESFWLAETLKYFYLLFSDPDTISLDEWVLNTEAHPFKRPLA